MEDALYDSWAVQRFVGVSLREALPEETIILNFPHLVERHNPGEAVVAEITRHLAAHGLRLQAGHDCGRDDPGGASVDENRARVREPEVHQVK